MQLETGITITTKKIEDFSVEMGILEFLRFLIHQSGNLPRELTIFGLDKLLFSSEEPEFLIKTLYFLFQKLEPYYCIQALVSCNIRSSGIMAFFHHKSREIKINGLFKRPFIRDYKPDRLYVSL